MQNQMIYDATQRATKKVGRQGTLVNNRLSRNPASFNTTFLKYSVCITQGIDRCIDSYIHTHTLVYRCHACQNSFLSCNLSGIIFKNFCLSCKHRICKSTYKQKTYTEFTFLLKFYFPVAPATGCTVLCMCCSGKQCIIFNADIDFLFPTTFNFSFLNTKGGNVYIYEAEILLIDANDERDTVCQRILFFLRKERGQSSTG